MKKGDDDIEEIIHANHQIRPHYNSHSWCERVPK